MGVTTMLRTLDGEETTHCPKCGTNWNGKEIDRDALAKGYYGHRAPCEKKREWDADWDENVPCTCPPRFYSRLIGVEYGYRHPDHYDGVSEWRCPDCGTSWSRWTGSELRDGAGQAYYRSVG